MKYYAVVSGVKPGIYTDWTTAEKMVKGFPGAIFKSFHTRREAERFMEQCNCNPIATETLSSSPPQTIPLIDKTIIYTDGSATNNSCGFGVVIITSNGDKITAHGKVPEILTINSKTNNVAELYAIYVALSLVKGDVILYSDSQYAISCLTSYIHDWMQNGWNGVANRNLIEGTYAKMQGRNVILRHVLAHSGFELNEEADKLAVQGRESSENLIILKNGNRIEI